MSRSRLSRPASARTQYGRCGSQPLHLLRWVGGSLCLPGPPRSSLSALLQQNYVRLVPALDGCAFVSRQKRKQEIIIISLTHRLLGKLCWLIQSVQSALNCTGRVGSVRGYLLSCFTLFQWVKTQFCHKEFNRFRFRFKLIKSKCNWEFGSLVTMATFQLVTDRRSYWLLSMGQARHHSLLM